MRYDIIINMDYENYTHDKVKALYHAIEAEMLAQGFVIDGRRFTIDLPAEEAQALARHVLDTVEQSRQESSGESAFPFIKEFFGFEPSHATNLLLPPTEEIAVQELLEIEGIEVVDLFKR